MGKIRFQNVSLNYSNGNSVKNVLENIDLEINKGELVCVIGPSGCGKSTLLSLLSGLNKPTNGTVTIDGQKIKGPGTDRGVVFQHYSLFPWLTARKNIIFGIKQAGKEKNKARILKRAQYFLDRVELSDSGDKYPFELSGGMQQRVALARTLAMDTDILLMDEPFGAIDPKVRYELQDLTLELCKDGDAKKTAVFVTHDIDEAIFLADRIIFMNPGGAYKDIKIPASIRNIRDRSLLFVNKDYKKLHDELVGLFYNDADEGKGLSGASYIEEHEIEVAV